MLLAGVGESDLVEFKSTSESVTAKVLVALANAVALSESDYATVFVGVDEAKDPDTGVMRGEVVGLVGDLDQHVHRVLNRASDTLPIPVDVRVIEEGVKTARPYLRLQVRPTAAPHYDAAGIRNTRQGRTTRALTDEEQLNLYLDREAVRFRQRFHETAASLFAELAQLGDQFDEAATELRNKLAELTEATRYAIEVSSGAAGLAEEMLTQQAEASDPVLDAIHETEKRRLFEYDSTAPGAYALAMSLRARVWGRFDEDTQHSESAATLRLYRDFKSALETPVDPNDWYSNGVESDFWRHKLAESRGRNSLKWWRDALRDFNRLQASPGPDPIKAPDFRQIRAQKLTRDDQIKLGLLRLVPFGLEDDYGLFGPQLRSVDP